MIESLYIAESGLSSQQKMIEVISNNIANSSTTGFKKSHVSFVDLVYQNEVQGAQTEVRGANGAGVALGEMSTDFSVGELKVTGNDFDISIRGNGFLEVIDGDGQLLYTRAGRLRVDEDGYLTIKSGERLTANIQVPPASERVIIENDGRVIADGGVKAGEVEIGRIELAKFTNEQNLVSVGGNKYLVEDSNGELIYATPGDLGTGEIAQGVTEVSNVSMTEEMVNLMLAQRGYQLNARIIQISDQLLDTINNLRR